VIDDCSTRGEAGFFLEVNLFGGDLVALFGDDINIGQFELIEDLGVYRSPDPADDVLLTSQIVTALCRANFDRAQDEFARLVQQAAPSVSPLRARGAGRLAPSSASHQPARPAALRDRDAPSTAPSSPSPSPGRHGSRKAVRFDRSKVLPRIAVERAGGRPGRS
jgi:hypothetical protein